LEIDAPDNEARVRVLPSVTLILAVLSVPFGPATAPIAGQDAVEPALELSPAQRQAIYRGVGATRRNNTVPTGFRASVGAHVPDAVKREPVSDTLTKLVPQLGSYEIAMVEKLVVVVDPRSKTVAAVVTGSKQ
jgi:hypothetical protein